MGPEDATSGTVDDDKEDADADLFRFPKRLSKRHRRFLKSTPDDRERRTVRELKCRLCPAAAFSNWGDFKRHCDYSEAHPLTMSFCDYCGDFFGRDDSRGRHCRNRPPECLSAKPDEALAKRRAAERLHVEFQEKLERYLKTNEGIVTPFAQGVKVMYPRSSKRGSRQQSRLKVRRSESSN
jgi:hypothetical protein